MSQICTELHNIVYRLPRHGFPFNEKEIPKNGIYILFEKGELGHGHDRIVRIGTHTGDNQLRSRLKQHFLKENKDRSIFRKNIGRCLLNASRDPYLSIWELDLTSSESKAKHAYRIQAKHQQEIEIKVSQYIQNQFTFCVIEVPSKEERLYLESRFISTVSNCQICGPSMQWLGQSSPIDKIKQSGLWQVNQLYKESLSDIDTDRLAVLVK
jgi:hypothetical protein